jgi:hypothetical protein
MKARAVAMIRGRADGRGKDEVEVSRLRSIKSAVMSEESPYPALSTRRCAKEPAPRNLRLADPNLTLTRMQCRAIVGNTGHRRCDIYAGFANPCNAQQPLTVHS